jgi:hypothetical protein
MEEWQAYNRWVARFRAYFVGNLGGTVEALILSFQGAGQIARGNFAVNALANVNSPDNALRLAAEIFAMGMAVAWDTHSQGGPEGRSDIRPPIL